MRSGRYPLFVSLIPAALPLLASEARKAPRRLSGEVLADAPGGCSWVGETSWATAADASGKGHPGTSRGTPALGRRA